jgi:hypothetical protein
MARVTNAELLERIEILEAEIALLREDKSPPVQLVREVRPPEPLPGRINFTEMAEQQGLAFAYSDSDWWGTNRYL